jgi:hypothetical protein
MRFWPKNHDLEKKQTQNKPKQTQFKANFDSKNHTYFQKKPNQTQFYPLQAVLPAPVS